MTKVQGINYPTEDWIEAWMDCWMENHPTERVTDFKALHEQAESAWWDNEIEHDRPTPYDLTAEQEKASKQARNGAKADKAHKTPVKRERKPNEEKRFIINLVQGCLTEADEVTAVNVVNIEREITFILGDNEYSLTLTCHRKPKGG